MLPLLLAALLSLAGAPPTAKAFIVVAHPDVPVTELPAERLSRIFLKKETRFSDALAAVPVDQPGASVVRQAFSEAVHRRAARAIEAWWQQQVFGGRGVPPVAVVDDAAVIAFVKGRPGGIGYVAATTPVTGVRVIAVVYPE
jgi:ABC-type phosphate transport system substrate-binding protein